MRDTCVRRSAGLVGGHDRARPRSQPAGRRSERRWRVATIAQRHRRSSRFGNVRRLPSTRYQASYEHEGDRNVDRRPSTPRQMPTPGWRAREPTSARRRQGRPGRRVEVVGIAGEGAVGAEEASQGELLIATLGVLHNDCGRGGAHDMPPESRGSEPRPPGPRLMEGPP